MPSPALALGMARNEARTHRRGRVPAAAPENGRDEMTPISPQPNVCQRNAMDLGLGLGACRAGPVLPVSCHLSSAAPTVKRLQSGANHRPRRRAAMQDSPPRGRRATGGRGGHLGLGREGRGGPKRRPVHVPPPLSQRSPPPTPCLLWPSRLAAYRSLSSVDDLISAAAAAPPAAYFMFSVSSFLRCLL